MMKQKMKQKIIKMIIMKMIMIWNKMSGIKMKYQKIKLMISK